MPTPSFVSTLPKPLLAQLNARLRKSGFGDLIEHAGWLTARGHPIKKSTLGRYALLYRNQVNARSAAAAVRLVDVRLACLQVAAGTGGENTLLARAKRYADWVLASED